MQTADPAATAPPTNTRRSKELERRIDVLEDRQSKIVDVLAGVSQAGRWLQNEIQEGRA